MLDRTFDKTSRASDNASQSGLVCLVLAFAPNSAPTLERRRRMARCPAKSTDTV